MEVQKGIFGRAYTCKEKSKNIYVFILKIKVLSRNFSNNKWKIHGSTFMTYSFTYPPKINVTISYVSEIRFWNCYLPTFWLDVIKYPGFFTASLSRRGEFTYNDYVSAINMYIKSKENENLRFVFSKYLVVLDTSILVSLV